MFFQIHQNSTKYIFHLHTDFHRSKTDRYSILPTLFLDLISQEMLSELSSDQSTDLSSFLSPFYPVINTLWRPVFLIKLNLWAPALERPSATFQALAMFLQWICTFHRSVLDHSLWAQALTMWSQQVPILWYEWYYLT